MLQTTCFFFVLFCWRITSLCFQATCGSEIILFVWGHSIFSAYPFCARRFCLRETDWNWFLCFPFYFVCLVYANPWGSLVAPELNFFLFCDKGWSRAAHWFSQPSVWKEHCGPRTTCWAMFKCIRLLFIVCSVVVRKAHFRTSTRWPFMIRRVLLWHSLSFRFVGCSSNSLPFRKLILPTRVEFDKTLYGRSFFVHHTFSLHADAAGPCLFFW